MLTSAVFILKMFCVLPKDHCFQITLRSQQLLLCLYGGQKKPSLTSIWWSYFSSFGRNCSARWAFEAIFCKSKLMFDLFWYLLIFLFTRWATNVRGERNANDHLPEPWALRTNSTLYLKDCTSVLYTYNLLHVIIFMRTISQQQYMLKFDVGCI